MTRSLKEYAKNYDAFRPGYASLVPLLEDSQALRSGAVVADLGAGTGFLAEQFLLAGYHVVAVEPLAEMRKAAALRLSSHRKLSIRAGTGEHTGLSSASVDLVGIASAFHWFNGELARRELRRILRPSGSIVLAWNVREIQESPFSVAFQGLRSRFLTYPPSEVNEGEMAAGLEMVLGHRGFEIERLPNPQHLDKGSFLGLLVATNCLPRPGSQRFEQMIEEFTRLFLAHEVDGKVALPYTSIVMVGPLAPR